MKALLSRIFISPLPEPFHRIRREIYHALGGAACAVPGLAFNSRLLLLGSFAALAIIIYLKERTESGHQPLSKTMQDLAFWLIGFGSLVILCRS